MGRKLDALEKVKSLSPEGRIRTVQITGDVAQDVRELTKFGPADVFFDISPKKQLKAHIHQLHSGIGARRASKPHGSIYGGVFMELTLPIMAMFQNDITLKFKFMYIKLDIRFMI